jgi:hypothetical protein
MRLCIAVRAFLKAFQQPEEGKRFLDSKPQSNITTTTTANSSASEHSHLRLLGLMQESSRLVDFLKEDLSSFDDAQIGAAARKVHEECGKCLEEVVTVRPLMEEPEGTKVTVPPGYDTTKMKVVGKVKGQPPYTGTLIHKGWKAHKRSLPKQTGEHLPEVICPAEIEVR